MMAIESLFLGYQFILFCERHDPDDIHTIARGFW